MKIKGYKLFMESHQTEESVRRICNKYGIENWSINSDGLVDVDGPEVVLGDYYLRDNKINSFEGFPDDFEGRIDFENNPVQKILDQFPINLRVKAIQLINDYDAIWRGEVVPERLEMVKEKLGII